MTMRGGDRPKDAHVEFSDVSVMPRSMWEAWSNCDPILNSGRLLGTGVVLDPFASSGSTIAAAQANGYRSVGVERDETYFQLSRTAMPALSALRVEPR